MRVLVVLLGALVSTRGQGFPGYRYDPLTIMSNPVSFEENSRDCNIKSFVRTDNISSINLANVDALRGSNLIYSKQPETNSEFEKAEKFVYVYAAPPDPEPKVITKFTPGPVVSRYSIIFVKGPTYKPSPPPEIKLPPTVNDKTIVYVLVQQPKELDPIEVPVTKPADPTKPEVIFVKYKSHKKIDNLTGIDEAVAINSDIDEDTVNEFLIKGGGLRNQEIDNKQIPQQVDNTNIIRQPSSVPYDAGILQNTMYNFQQLPMRINDPTKINPPSVYRHGDKKDTRPPPTQQVRYSFDKSEQSLEDDGFDEEDEFDEKK